MRERVITRMILAASSLCPLASAADAEPPSEEVAAGSALDAEIIVTARKRQERLLDVPVSATALSGEQLERYSITSIESVARQTPQLVIAEYQGSIGATVSLRGFGAGISNPSTDPSVSLNFDGIQVGDGNSIRLGQFDLERVEVLKGPQALFYGKNSPGGIVSFISRDPGSDFEAQLRTGYEFLSQQRYVEAVASGPLTETVGGRLVGYYSKKRGWFRNIGVPIAGVTPGPAAKHDNAEEIFVRGTLNFRTPDNEFSMKIKVNYGQVEREGIGPSWQSHIFFCPFGAPQAGGGTTTDCRVDRRFTDVALSPAIAALHPVFASGVPFVSSKQLLASLTANYQLSDGLTLTSVSGLHRIKTRNIDSFGLTNLPQVVAGNFITNRNFSEEIRLLSDYSGPLNFLVGGFYQKGKYTILNPLVITVVAPVLSPVNFHRLDTEAYSAFGQLRYDLTKQVELSVGGRYSHERKELSGTINGSPIITLRPNRSFKDFSPELTVSYKPVPDLNIYASYREGFTSGGYNTSPVVLRTPANPAGALRDQSYDQMTARGGELGIKGYIDRQLRFDITGYYYKLKGIQLSSFDPLTVSSNVRNAAGAKVRGVEINTYFRPRALRGFEARIGGAYNRANYTNYIGVCYGGQSIAQGCNLLPRNASLPASTFGTSANPFTSQDQSGQSLVRAPRWNFNAGATYDHEFNQGLGGTLSFDSRYMSRQVTQFEAHPAARQKGFFTLEGSMSLYGGKDRGWQVSLIGRNLTNKLAIVATAGVPLTGSGTGTATARSADLSTGTSEPRAVVLQLTLRDTLLRR